MGKDEGWRKKSGIKVLMGINYCRKTRVPK